MMPDYEAVKAARRRIENRIRVDCADMERAGIDPEEIETALQATLEFWRGEIQDIG
jgi:hypothetical protein